MRFSLVIPVRNGGELFVEAMHAIKSQSLLPAEILIFDTESTDDAVAQAKKIFRGIPLSITTVATTVFDHGGTRNRALKAAKSPWVLFMTQDAICADRNTFAALIAETSGKKTAAVYGRQLPHHDAMPLAATARVANYGDKPLVQDLAHAQVMGIKTWFTSNSFCIWQKAALISVGGFAEKLILGEDMHAAARLIQAGYKVHYQPAAQVRHSHNYTALEEFRRYFDIGVFHAQNTQLLFVAGNANKEGLKFVLTQARQIWRQRAILDLLRMPLHIGAKYLGYKAGRNFNRLGSKFSRRLSMHKNYWP